ncbi:helix-turn-helix domain-containing protein [Larkinella sp. VNQ87]|uniref:helix-turn-helix domain-containing protein n=1 Tax=Larkinella sp. VNQ87 TaxID=3400921 RepID=UPI003C06E655
MVFFVTTVAFVQTLVVLYLLPLRGSQSRNYPYIRVLLLSLILHLGIKMYLLGVLQDAFLFGRLNSFTSFSYGPLLLFQFRQSMGRPLRRSVKMLHLLPFLVAFGLYVYCVVSLLPTAELALFHRIFSVYRYSVMGSCLLYFSYLLWALQRERDALPPLDRQLMVRVSSLFLVAMLGGHLVNRLAERLAIPYEPHIFPYAMFGLISFLCLRFFFTQPSPGLSMAPLPVDEPEPLEKEPVAYEKSGLSDAQLAEGWQMLEHLMQREKPYTNPDLSLDDLAERLQLSRQHISQILSQKAGRNFYAYINEYRVAEMQRLMREKPAGRILELAFAVGFQSKTTLNAYFRKVTGFSPTEYQQQLRPQRRETVKT